MLDWFERTAPIRVKFKVLLGIQTVLSCVGVASTMAAGAGFGPIAVALAATAGTVATMVIASRRICDPYVNTVVRMEALAAGDTESPIAYTDFKDCVGRMTKAMQSFRDNAVAVAESKVAQDKVVTELGVGLRHLSEGKLDFELNDAFPGDYEVLRTDFNSAISALRQTVSGVVSGIQSISTASTEIRAASDDLALRNEQQAASLEETAAAMNQVTSSVGETASNASEVQLSIAGAHREATEGGAVVRRAIEAMAAIETSSQEISQIITVIDGIAFQTNLLALNAGVEAARAGDAGKGFAVVANEVRALAQRSAEAAKDIKNLITTSTDQVGSGVNLVGETGTLLERIVSSVGEINELVRGIAEAANAQAANLQQVNSAVGEMDRMTQQNAAMVEQSTAAARGLADEAAGLSRLVSQFQTGGGADTTVHFSPPSRRKAKAPSVPAVHGNLALKPPSDGDDWSEF